MSDANFQSMREIINIEKVSYLERKRIGMIREHRTVKVITDAKRHFSRKCIEGIDLPKKHHRTLAP